MHLKARRFFTIAVALLLAATLAFIWGNSLESLEKSSAKSKSAMEDIAPLLEFFIGRATDHIVRKLAHFAEFSVLGGELAVLAVLRRRVRIQPVINCLSAGLAASVTDEALQLLPGRGSQVSDILLDFTGTVTGILFILLIYKIAALCRTRKAK